MKYIALTDIEVDGKLFLEGSEITFPTEDRLLAAIDRGLVDEKPEKKSSKKK